MLHKLQISPNMTMSFTSTPYFKFFHCAFTVYYENLKSLISATLFSSLSLPFFFNWNLVILEDIDSHLVLFTGGNFKISPPIYHGDWRWGRCPLSVLLFFLDCCISLFSPKDKILWSTSLLGNLQTSPFIHWRFENLDYCFHYSWLQ